MNILLLIHSLSGGGAERVAANLANHWAGLGWTVSLATFASPESDAYPLDERVRRVHLGGFAPSATPLHAAWATVARVRALRRALRELRPDVAMSLMAPANLLMALGAWRAHGVRSIGCEHTHPPLDPMGPLRERLRRVLYPRLDAVVTLTADSADWIRANVPARRVAVIPNPVAWPLQDTAPRVDPDAMLAPDRRLLLGVGRLQTPKGFHLLIDAFAGLAARHPQWTLAIVGEGPEAAPLTRQAQALGLADRVLLTGRVGNVAAWYRRADLFVSASLLEGFPIALTEAMAHERPAVVFDCDTGPREIVRDGVDGVLVPNGDTGRLQAALDALMGDDDRRAAMGRCAGEARRRFSMAGVSGRWQALFEELRGSPGV